MTAPEPAATPPLRRHPVLHPLSREHFGGLVLARNLLRAAEAGADARGAALRAFLRAWDEELAPHFQDEEELLLPLLPDDRLLDRLVSEHRDLRGVAGEAAAFPRPGAPEPAWLRRLAALLHDHIRWEERTLFPAIERVMSDADAERIGCRTREIERLRAGARRRQDLFPAGGAARATAVQESDMDQASRDRLRERPSDRFNAEQACFNLAEAAAKLRAEADPHPAGHRQTVLFRRGPTTVALFVFEPGSSLPAHHAGGTVLIHTVEGELVVGTDEAEHRLPSGAVLVLAPNVRHSVTALIRAAMLLTVHLAPTN